MLKPKPSDLLKKLPASEALLIMAYVAHVYKLNLLRPKNWPIIYRIIDHNVARN